LGTHASIPSTTRLFLGHTAQPTSRAHQQEMQSRNAIKAGGYLVLQQKAAKKIVRKKNVKSKIQKRDKMRMKDATLRENASRSMHNPKIIERHQDSDSGLTKRPALFHGCSNQSSTKKKKKGEKKMN